MKRYLILLLVGLAAYAATLVVSKKLLANEIDGAATNIFLSLAPMLPAIFICGIIVRTISQMDEMQRKLQFEALVLAFTGTALISFGYGFLEGSGFPKLSMFVVWPFMATLWAIGLVFGRMRYR
ncbi:MAG: hypothetical protein JKY83_03410 [Rhizobiaceae bacterium]|nr:hypothetical protein [Rhizobiaceae bacterium]